MDGIALKTSEEIDAALREWLGWKRVAPLPEDICGTAEIWLGPGGERVCGHCNPDCLPSPTTDPNGLNLVLEVLGRNCVFDIVKRPAGYQVKISPRTKDGEFSRWHTGPWDESLPRAVGLAALQLLREGWGGKTNV